MKDDDRISANLKTDISMLVIDTDCRGGKMCLFGIKINTEVKICGEINRIIQYDSELCKTLEAISSWM
jgi:hypothetical protein